MSLTKDCAPHIANIVFGCAGLTFGGIVLAAAGPAGAAVSLAALVGIELRKAKPESKKQIERLIAHIAKETRARIDEEGWGKYERGSLVTKAQERLSVYLPALDVEHGRLGRDAFKEGGFPKAATRRIVAAIVAAEAVDETVAEDAKLFQGAAETQVALDFVNDVFDHAFGLALVDRNYFESLEPHLIVGIAERVGKIDRTQDAHGEQLDRMEAILKSLASGGARDPSAIANAVARQGEVELPEALLAALAERTDASLSLEDQVADLITRFDAAQEIIREGSAPSNLDAFVTAVQKRVAEKTLAGDLDGADAEAEDAFAQWERDESERAEAAQRNGVALIETAIETALALGEAEAVARREMRKIELTVPEEERFQAARDVQDIYDKRGQIYGARIDLRIAVALAHAYGQTDNREHWAIAKNDLGLVLQVLGERGEEGALQEAVTAYRAALEIYTREDAPMDWAMTQNNLGNVLSTLGERGKEGALQEAVTAYRAALEVYTREDAPMDWAMTQNNLGTVLQVLGERGEEGALQDAVVAYRAALQLYTREAAPMNWAATQNNLGVVLKVLGERGDEDSLQDAIKTYRAALEVYTREAAPMDWAMTQNNLGAALRVLGSRGEEGALQDAIAAYHAALEVRTREAAPMDWAMTQENLALLFMVMADRADEPRLRLEAALEAVSEALEVYRKVGATFDIGIAERLEAHLREKLVGL